jgi:hypothetical protein
MRDPQSPTQHLGLSALPRPRGAKDEKVSTHDDFR